MKKLIASSLAAFIAAAAIAAVPAQGQPQRKTELVALDGASVDKLVLQHDFNAVWVVDASRLLYRDDTKDHYLVTMAKACKQLEVRSRGFAFHPGSSPMLFADHSYEVRPDAGPYCDVSKIEQVDDAKAGALRDVALRRAW